MAKYKTTYHCEHTDRVLICGKPDDRQRETARQAQNLCPDCRKRKQEEDERAAAAESAALGMPTLTGSPKQIAWATDARLSFHKLVTAAIATDERKIAAIAARTSRPIENVRAVYTAVGEMLRADWEWGIAHQTDAGWWIARRQQSPLTVLRTIRDCKQENEA